MPRRGIVIGLTAPIACGIVFFAAAQQKLPLPPPFATPSAQNQPRVVAKPENARLNVPQGFQVEMYAEGFQRPRFLLLGPGNELLLSDSADQGAVYVLYGKDGKERKKLIDGLWRPYGLAIHDGYLYVGEPDSVKRYRYDSKELTAGPGEEILSFKAFVQHNSTGHWTRSLLFDREGKKLYIGIGSQSNASPNDDPHRAAINRSNPDGTGLEIFAAGTRNPIGLHWYPGTDELWAAVQERDGLGDDLVPDFLTHIQPGGFYGWPYAYAGPNEDPRNKGLKPELVAKTIQGDVLLGSHVAVLDFTFYTGTQFPREYRGGAFLALHGSWNRSKRVGQEIVFVPFRHGKPTGAMKTVVGGWMLSPDDREVWGRPVAVVQMPDGSLVISDDGGKKLWRLSYKG